VASCPGEERKGNGKGRGGEEKRKERVPEGKGR